MEKNYWGWQIGEAENTPKHVCKLFLLRSLSQSEGRESTLRHFLHRTMLWRGNSRAGKWKLQSVQLLGRLLCCSIDVRGYVCFEFYDYYVGYMERSHGDVYFICYDVFFDEEVFSCYSWNIYRENSKFVSGSCDFSTTTCFGLETMCCKDWYWR